MLEGKPRISVLPIDVLIEVTKAFEHGIGKYEEGDWSKGYSWRSYYDKALRHILASLEGEDNDKESGLDHITKALGDLMILRALQLRGYTQFDDRPVDVNKLINDFEYSKLCGCDDCRKARRKEIK